MKRVKLPGGESVPALGIGTWKIGVGDRDVIAQLLDRLPERERTILVLRFFEGMTQSQIAERIGTSQVHVGRLITSSLAVLRAHLTAAARAE